MTAQPGTNITQVSGQDIPGAVPVTNPQDETRIWLRAIAMILIEAYQLPNSPVEYFDAAQAADFLTDR